MSDFLVKCFQAALEGSVVLLIVMLLRLLLKKAPKKYLCFLWTVALLRLCCPYLPEGPIPAFWRTGPVGEQQEAAGAELTEQLSDDLTKESGESSLGAQKENVAPVVSDSNRGETGWSPVTDAAEDAFDRSEDTPLSDAAKPQNVLDINEEKGQSSYGDMEIPLAEAEIETSLETPSVTESLATDKVLFLLGLLWLVGAIAAVDREVPETIKTVAGGTACL